MTVQKILDLADNTIAIRMSGTDDLFIYEWNGQTWTHERYEEKTLSHAFVSSLFVYGIEARNNALVLCVTCK